MQTTSLECDEPILTGECLRAHKNARAVAAMTPLADLCHLTLPWLAPIRLTCARAAGRP